MKYGIGLSEAFRTITILPFPGKDAKNTSSSLFFYPLVGAFLGALSTLPAFIAPHNTVLGVVLLGLTWTALMAYLTRAFHLDGLADVFDGFGGGWDKEARLKIMKDSRLGSFGTIALIILLCFKIISSALIIRSSMLWVLIASTTFSRCFVVLQCALGNYAKEEGLAKSLTDNAKWYHVLIAFAPCLVVFYWLWPEIIASFAATLVLLLTANKKIGGLTGDVLGATCELSEAVFLVSFCFLEGLL